MLVNPGDNVLTGTVQFFDQLGQTAAVNVSGQTNSSFLYSIAPRSATKLQTAGTGTGGTVGSVRVGPAAGTNAPSGLAIFSFRNQEATVAEAGVPAISVASTFRLYAEASGDFNRGASGSIQTGIAVTNTAAAPATVTMEIFNLDGARD